MTTRSTPPLAGPGLLGLFCALALLLPPSASSQELGGGGSASPPVVAGTTPVGTEEAAVRALLARAEAALARAPHGQELSAAALRRARRLIVGARAAVQGGDLSRAALRATYGCQLLGGCWPPTAEVR